jgi:hypothetical protein
MSINIWGKYLNRVPEKIDVAESAEEAAYMVRQYQLGFGKNWIIWSGKRKDLTDYLAVFKDPSTT